MTLEEPDDDDEEKGDNLCTLIVSLMQKRSRTVADEEALLSIGTFS